MVVSACLVNLMYVTACTVFMHIDNVSVDTGWMSRWILFSFNADCSHSYMLALSLLITLLHVLIVNRRACDAVEGIVVDQNQALRFALDVARGMEFLHSMEPLIPNLTLNSKHIMVTNQWNFIIVVCWIKFSLTVEMFRCTMMLLCQVDEDLAKINVDDPRYQRDDQDGFANGVWVRHSA